MRLIGCLSLRGKQSLVDFGGSGGDKHDLVAMREHKILVESVLVGMNWD